MLRIVEKGCVDSLVGVDSSRFHRMKFTLVYRGCG